MAREFPALKNDLILRAIRGEHIERTPVWIMRQAGRYLPEFRKVRSEHTFFEVVRNPELVCQVTLQPIRRYDLDAAIIFSDILIVCQAMGMEVDMLPEGPTFRQPLREPSDLERLKVSVNVQQEMKYLLDAITLTRHHLDGRCPLIGFAGAPWTLMAYMTKTSTGGASRDFCQSRKWLHKYPEHSRELLSRIAQVVAHLLIQQAVAGAQMLMLFESHADVLGPELFLKFSHPYIEDIAKAVRSAGIHVPLILFAKGAHYALETLAQSQFDVITLDWTIDPTVLRKMSLTKTYMGNLDPATLYGSERSIVDCTKTMLAKFAGLRHICNLGHGIYPDVEPEAVNTFVETVRAWKP